MESLEHCTNEQLIDYLDDRLGPTTLNQVLKHLKTGCHECNTSLIYFERILTAVETLHWESPSPIFHKRAISAYALYYPETIKPKPISTPVLRPIFLGLLIVTLVFYSFLFPLTPDVVYAGYVEKLTGIVEMLDPSTESWRPVTQAQSIPVNATIRTLSGSQVTISFPGGEKTTLSSESEVQLETITNSHGFWDISIEQNSGKIENHTSKNTRAFQVITSAGVITSSNAHFMMNISEDGSVITNVVKGELFTAYLPENLVIHHGETLIFPAENITSISSQDIGIIPSSTIKPLDNVTTTAIYDGKPKVTPTPKAQPTKKNDPAKSDESNPSCFPGNSDGSGNSDGAHNSPESCK